MDAHLLDRMDSVRDFRIHRIDGDDISKALGDVM